MRKRKTIVCQTSAEKPVLKVFEAFSGIGAQNSALKSLGVPYKVVGTSDWFVNAVIAYDALHSDQSEEIDVPTYEEQLKYLKQFTFSAESQREINHLEGLGHETISGYTSLRNEPTIAAPSPTSSRKDFRTSTC